MPPRSTKAKPNPMAQTVALLPAPQRGISGEKITGMGIPGPTPITSIEGSAYLPRELKEQLARRLSGLQGFSAPELAAARSQMAAIQTGTEKARERALESQLAKSDVRGGAALAARQRAAMLAQQGRAQMGQELFLKDVAQKQAAQQAYEQTLMGGLGVAQKGQFMDLAAQLTQQQLAASEKAAERQAEAIEKYGASIAAAQAAAAGGAGKPVAQGGSVIDALGNTVGALFGKGWIW